MKAIAIIFLLPLAIISALFAGRCFRVLHYFGVAACALGCLGVGLPFLLPYVLPRESPADYFVRQLEHKESIFDTILHPWTTIFFGEVSLLFGVGILYELWGWRKRGRLAHRTSTRLTTRSSERRVGVRPSSRRR